MPYGLISMVNIDPGNGLLLDSTKPLPEPMLTYHEQGPSAFMGGQEMLEISITDNQ